MSGLKAVVVDGLPVMTVGKVVEALSRLDQNLPLSVQIGELSTYVASVRVSHIELEEPEVTIHGFATEQAVVSPLWDVPVELKMSPREFAERYEQKW